MNSLDTNLQNGLISLRSIEDESWRPGEAERNATRWEQCGDNGRPERPIMPWLQQAATDDRYRSHVLTTCISLVGRKTLTGLEYCDDCDSFHCSILETSWLCSCGTSRNKCRPANGFEMNAMHCIHAPLKMSDVVENAREEMTVLLPLLPFISS